MSTLQTNVEYLSNRIISRDNQLIENKMNQDNEGMAIYAISRRQWVSHSLLFVRYNTLLVQHNFFPLLLILSSNHQ